MSKNCARERAGARAPELPGLHAPGGRGRRAGRAGTPRTCAEPPHAGGRLPAAIGGNLGRCGGPPRASGGRYSVCCPAARTTSAQEELSLRFVRLEPYVVPKQSLTGANTERVDTRVVQVIYALDSEQRLVREQKVLVGQLVDVFIDTRPPAGGQ